MAKGLPGLSNEGIFGLPVDPLTGSVVKALGLGPDEPKTTTPTPAPVPSPAPAAPVDMTNFANVRPASVDTAPSFPGLSAGMTPLQQRSSLATNLLNSDLASPSDAEALKLYRDIATFDLTDPSGAVRGSAQVLPIERQLAGQGFNQEPLSNSIESFLSAIHRYDA